MPLISKRFTGALISQREGFDTAMQSFKSGVFEKCRSMFGGFSAESESAAGPQGERQLAAARVNPATLAAVMTLRLSQGQTAPRWTAYQAVFRCLS